MPLSYKLIVICLFWIGISVLGRAAELMNFKWLWLWLQLRPENIDSDSSSDSALTPA